MHDLACMLRPSPRPDALPAPDAGAPNLARRSPFPPLLPSWQETFSFSLLVLNNTFEIAWSPLIYGPFRLLEFAHRSSVSGTILQKLRIVVANANTAPTLLLDAPSGTPQRFAVDDTQTLGAFYTNTLFQRHTLNQTYQSDLTRIGLALDNTQGGTSVVQAVVTIDHLQPADRADVSPGI